MFGVVLYEMLTGARLITTITMDSDSITTKDTDRLRHWKGLPEACKTKVLSNCIDSTTNMGLERQNAISLLNGLLAATPEKRMKNFPNGMDDVLNHPFWEPAITPTEAEPERARSEGRGVNAGCLLGTWSQGTWSQGDFEAQVEEAVLIASKNPGLYGLAQTHNFNLQTLTFKDLAPIMAYHHSDAAVVCEPAAYPPARILAQGYGKVCPRDGKDHCALVSSGLDRRTVIQYS